MSDEVALLQAIRANLHDDLPRLVYADWLEERDDPRHQYLRLECELVRTWGYTNPRRDLFTRLAVQRAQFDPNWLAQVRRCTTPTPPVDVTEIHPDLKAMAKTTVRLHPRPGEVAIDASKIGGKFLWPAKEEWPHCSEHDCPFVCALQLRKEDVPEVGFKPDTDLFQLLWCPQRHDPDYHLEAKAYWRKRKVIRHLAEPPALPDGEYRYASVPCLVHPERLVEFPDMFEVGKDVQAAIASSAEVVRAAGVVRQLTTTHWTALHSEEDMYPSWLSVCGGTKVGGHPSWVHDPTPPHCTCEEPMELLAQLGSLEFDGGTWGRWLPIQDREALTADFQTRWAERNPAHASFGDAGRIYVFICRVCKVLPVRAFMHSN